MPRLPGLFVFACAAAWTPAARAEPPQRICGVVIEVSCADKPTVLTLLVEPGISAIVEAPTLDAARVLREQVAPLRWARACATGRLVEKQNEVHQARLAVETFDAIVGDGPGPADWPTADVFTKCDKGVVMPTVKLPARPSYTKAAMNKGIQGAAFIHAIVGTDGRVEQARLVKSLDAKFGLDEEALKAAKAWRFHPASKDGAPVRMLITLELTFTLRK